MKAIETGGRVSGNGKGTTCATTKLIRAPRLQAKYPAILRAARVPCVFVKMTLTSSFALAPACGAPFLSRGPLPKLHERTVDLAAHRHHPLLSYTAAPKRGINKP